MGISTNPNQPDATFAQTGEIKPPVIEYVKNTPASTKHLPCANSSWLESVSYDSSSLRMTINTKSGASWQHAMVYPAQFAEMQLQNSIGSFYTKNIKGKHPIVHIHKIATLSNFPKRKGQHETKSRFDTITSGRYSGGRYA